MPIVGLTDSTRPTLLGMIRIGEKKRSVNTGKEYPSKLDHFIFDPKVEDERQRAAILAAIEGVYGKTPKLLRVKFHSNNPTDIFDANYCLWQASGLLCKGDGKTALRLDDKYVQMREQRAPKTGTDPDDRIEDETLDGETYTRVVCHTPGACAYALARGAHGKPGCAAKGFLRVILPDLPGLGVWGLSTGSINSIAQLNSAVQYLCGAFGGRLFGHEANLIITPKQGIIPETQKTTDIFVLNLTTEHSFNQLARIAAQPTVPAGLIGHEERELDEDIDGNIIDAETGEILDAPSPTLADDTEVQRALAESGFSAAKQRALLASALEHGWTREQMLRNIAAQSSTPAAAAPARTAAPAPARGGAPAGANGGRPASSGQLF